MRESSMSLPARLVSQMSCDALQDSTASTKSHVCIIRDRRQLDHEDTLGGDALYRKLFKEFSMRGKRNRLGFGVGIARQ